MNRVSVFQKILRPLKDPNRKSILKIVVEFIMESIKNKRIAKEYFSRFVYRKGSAPLSSFLSDQEIGKLQLSRVLHSDETVETLVSKLKFYQFCKANNLPTPKVLAYSKDSKLFNFDGEYPTLSVEDFYDLIKEWVQTSPHQSIFIKPNDSKGGEGAFKVSEDNIDNKAYVEKIYQTVHKRNYLIQETIKQHEALAAINPWAINTIRMDTYKPLDEPSRVMSAIIRFGRSGFIIDNQVSTTGFFIGLDINTHKLKGPGLQLVASGNGLVTHHPDTNVEVDGYFIPHMEEAKALLNRATELLGDRLVGWDIGMSVDGPIIIEGNHNYHMAMQEIAYGGYKTHPDFRRVLKEENLL